jgi:hypothetical protein
MTAAVKVLPTRPCSRCGKRHRSWRTIAMCRWPRATWISGDPPFAGPCFASVSSCSGFRRSGATVILYGVEDRAIEAKTMIDRLGCGGGCSRQHAIVVLGTA